MLSIIDARAKKAKLKAMRRLARFRQVQRRGTDHLRACDLESAVACDVASAETIGMLRTYAAACPSWAKPSSDRPNIRRPVRRRNLDPRLRAGRRAVRAHPRALVPLPLWADVSLQLIAMEAAARDAQVPWRSGGGRNVRQSEVLETSAPWAGAAAR